ncbi:MAG: hypothetical protein ABJB02_09075 [Dokdonella sp.]
MPDLVIHNVDSVVSERIRQVAAERNWSLDEVLLHALRYALGLGGESLVSRERRDIARLRGTWNSDETAMFDAALTAFEHIEGAPLFEGGNRGSSTNTGGRKG